MRTALLIGFIHGDASPRILATGNPAECNSEFKKLVSAPGPFSALQLWESGSGITKRKRFEATKEAVATATAGFKKAAALAVECDTLRQQLEAFKAENAKLREAVEEPPGKKQKPS